MTNDESSTVSEQLVAFRVRREQVERSLLPLATSVDGRSFTFQASLHDLELRLGGYVILEAQAGPQLGQITEIGMDSDVVSAQGFEDRGSSVRIRRAIGSGLVLERDGSPFHDSTIRPARPDEVAATVAGPPTQRAGLTIGEHLLAPGVPATLDSGGLARHTFMCGQSGSGKTYSLGLLLERVLAETSLRVVILDPNSDHVRLAHVRDDADADLAARYADVPADVAVWSNDPGAAHPLRLKFADLAPASQAAVLGLDPVRDRDEYAVLIDLLERQEKGRPLVIGAEQLLEAKDPATLQLGQRASNLGVLGWDIWDPASPSLVEELREPTARCTVIDLGSLHTMQEQRVVAEATLSTLWESRLTRRPTLIVVDEAHNICPADPPDPMTSLSSERAVQIAAEGRKYGLYLLTSTQRPHKVHENVVSQCDNLVMMRMNSQADVADLAALFSFVPPGLMSGATSFRMGQALVAGKILAHPSYVQMGRRVSEEGGADIPATWATPRST